MVSSEKISLFNMQFLCILYGKVSEKDPADFSDKLRENLSFKIANSIISEFLSAERPYENSVL
jgi:hypothetical protein